LAASVGGLANSQGISPALPGWPRQEPSWRALAGRRDALVGATVLFWGATEECLDIGSPAGCPAFAWPNSYSGCLDDVIRPSGALQEVEFAAATG
jgi:hypothetical protein